MKAALSQRLVELKGVIRQHRDSVQAWLEALYEIKESGLFLEEADTWDQWCLEHTGITSSAVRNIAWREKQRQAHRMIPETTGEKVEKPASVLDKKDIDVEIVKENLPVSARRDRSEVVTHVIPSEPPKQSAKPIRVDVRLNLFEAIRDVEHVLGLSDLPACAFRYLADCRSRISSVRDFVLSQESLPGAELWEVKKSAARGSRQEMQAYAPAIGLPVSDGGWFHDKMKATGWRNDGKPVADWQATMRVWKAKGGIFPSQSQVVNGKVVVKEKSIAEKDLERMLGEEI